MRKGESGLFRHKAKIAAFLAIAPVLLACGLLILNSAQRYYYKRVAAEAQRFAKSYANNLETALDASSIINRLLGEKLLAAGQMVLRREDDLSSERLHQIADIMHVDELYAYNSDGIIAYSNNGRDIGREAISEHSVYQFWKSGDISLVEEIKQDPESGIYYKYGYFRGISGYFVQAGVLADRISSILGYFDTQRMLQEMATDPYIINVTFLDAATTASAFAQSGSEILPSQALSAMEAGKEYIEPLKGGSIYRVILPVDANSNESGTLILQYNLSDTKLLVNHISIIGFVSLLLLYGLMLAVSLANYRKGKRNAHYAYHDPVSDLPNRRRFEEVFGAGMASCGHGKRAVLLVNYRNFKQINLLFGYQYGDKVIRDLAARLQTLCTDHSLLFHLSVDRFAFYVEGYRDKEELRALCFRIMDALKQALPSKAIGGSIGVVEAEYFAGGADTVLKFANLAGMFVGEEEPFGFRFYSGEMEARLKRDAEIEEELQAAASGIEGSGMYLMYQPILNLATGSVQGMEALARLKCRKLGEVSPAEFIPIAEKSQLIVPLGRQILREACRFLKILQAAGHHKTKVSVNISALELMRDDFVKDILATVSETEVNAGCLVLEITESSFADRIDEINGKLRALKAYGIHVAIDDFGTGYSSLARERDLEISCLKVDRSFIARLSELPADKDITRDIISMAHRLGHVVVAEGVETVNQKEYLQRAGCDFIQGYLFSKPLLSKDAVLLLKEEERKARTLPA